jgi:endonuclease G
MKARRLVVCLIIVAALIAFALLSSATLIQAGAQSTHEAAEHLVMGNPSGATTDTNNPNNYLMQKPQYALSYSRDRGTPNWVSWHLDGSWITKVADRQDDFRADTALPSGWYQVQARDYDFSHTGFQRGHMCPSGDRTSSVTDNSATFLMTNFVPQSPDNNQGPWEKFETYLRTLVEQGNEVYIISGPYGAGGQGSVNSGITTTITNGRVTVPQKTWKVALVLPTGEQDVSRVTASTRTIAVIVPNIQGIRSNSWQKYLATVDQVEALTGYNFFSSVAANVQAAIESKLDAANNSAPVAASQSVTTQQNTPVQITLGATDSNVNNSLVYSMVTVPAHGTLSGTLPNLTYTPAANFSGTDSFTFRASDGTTDSNIATININVLAGAP